MNSPPSGAEPQHPHLGGYSPDCTDIFYDGPTHAKEQPVSLALLGLLRATREKLILHGAIKASLRSDGATAAPPAVLTTDNSPIRVPLDAALLLRLQGLSRPVELVDENGRVVAVVMLVSEGSGHSQQPPCQGDEAQPKN